MARNTSADLVIAGRSSKRAEALVRELQQVDRKGTIKPATLDHSSAGFQRALGALRPNVVVHTAGPFQQQDYRVAEACLRYASHYVDLADGRRFVADFSRLDAAAKRRGVLLVAGASTLPAVSSAVVDDLAREMSNIERIETAILPANRTERGHSTIAAVFGYVGKKISVLQDGKWTTKHGWLDIRKIDHPICARWAGVCDVPDLELFPKRYPLANTITFHAGLELGWQQFGMWLMAWLARVGIVSDWSKQAGLFARISARLVSLGSDVGGMQVRVIGRDGAGKCVARTWNLTAGSNHGPEIPCIPARIVAMKMARNELRQRGAMACMDLMSAKEFAAAAGEFDIEWDIATRTG
ncbi:saccharopine dehydrogenase family protein [Candidatus Foliamicus sp.]